MSMHAHGEIAREATTVVVLAEEVGAVRASAFLCWRSSTSWQRAGA